MTTATQNLHCDDPAQAVRVDSTAADAAKELCGVTEGVASHGGEGESFITAYLIVVNSLTETLHREVARVCGVPVDRARADQRIEVCAAVWTTIRVALAASLLTSAQQQLVLDVLGRRLRLRWDEDLGAADENAGPITQRAAFYLQLVDPQDPMTTASLIVGILLEAAQVPQFDRERHSRLLCGLIAHRIVSDVWLFNAWESEGKVGTFATARR